MIGYVILAGALAGLGAFLIVRELTPAPPSLRAALSRFDGRARRPYADIAPSDLAPRIGCWLHARVAGTWIDPRIPRRDLAVTGKSVEAYLTQKLLMTCFGLATPSLFWAALMPSATWMLTTGFVLVFATVMFCAPDIAVRSQAREAREEFCVALVAYLDLVKMARAGGAGPAEALEAPTKVCHGWVFARLATALDPATRGTRDTWDELTRLAEQIGVPELSETASIARRAGTQGARILDSLTAKAASLRDQQLSQALASAKSRTETMTLPVALSVLGYLILLGYPAYSRITGG